MPLFPKAILVGGAFQEVLRTSVRQSLEMLSGYTGPVVLRLDDSALKYHIFISTFHPASGNTAFFLIQAEDRCYSKTHLFAPALKRSPSIPKRLSHLETVERPLLSRYLPHLTWIPNHRSFVLILIVLSPFLSH